MTADKHAAVDHEQAVISIGNNPFFAPPGGVLGDTFPFFHNGECHLFTLQPPHVAHFVSRDFVNWEVHPIAIAPGASEAPDAGMIATGVVVEKDGLFYMFYTAGPAQTICLATSTDLDNWTKDPRNPILVPDNIRYTEGYFRDPYVFYNSDEDAWWMLLGSRVPGRVGPRAGCVGLAKSADLLNWTLSAPLWAPGIGPHHDCPQLIRHEENWYLFYLQRNTRYRIANNPSGPFERPPIRDIGVLYAAAGSRPVFDGKRWITFPFVIRLEGKDEWGDWQYGGPLAIPRELHLTDQQEIFEQPLREVVDALRRLPSRIPEQSSLRVLIGQWDTAEPGKLVCRSDAGGTLLIPNVPPSMFFESNVILPSRNMEAHIILRASEGLESGYKIAFRPGEQAADVRHISEIDIDRVMVTRNVSLPVGKPIKVQIFVSGDVLEAFVGDRASLTARVYDIREGALVLEFRDSPGAFHGTSICEFQQELVEV